VIGAISDHALGGGVTVVEIDHLRAEGANRMTGLSPPATAARSKTSISMGVDSSRLYRRGHLGNPNRGTDPIESGEEDLSRHLW
jgi:hypothetical protein